MDGRCEQPAGFSLSPRRKSNKIARLGPQAEHAPQAIEIAGAVRATFLIDRQKGDFRREYRVWRSRCF
jgi:hypothetical protein